MKVSIIIPVYNVQDYILRCLHSVCMQTYKDIECILVDDCGKDKSIQIAEEFILHYTGNIQFKLLHHNHNLGLSGARNTGIKQSIGDYLFFLDSDDIITDDCIETLVLLANKYPNAGFVQGNFGGADNKKSPYAFSNSIPEYCNNKEDLEVLILHKLVTSSCNRLINRSLIINHQLFFPIGLYHEDMYWVYFMSRYIKAAAFTTKETYIYTVHEGTIMTSISKEMCVRRLLSRITASDAYYYDIKSNKVSSHARRAYLCINLFSCLHELNLLHSLWFWVKFWCYISKIGIYNINKLTFSRILFIVVLLPPVCFFARKEALRWRIQNTIINRI